MPKSYPVIALILVALILLANSSNPPNGKTGAPGDGFCTECHSQSATSLNGDISVTGFPATIQPNQTYSLTVTNRNTAGNGVKAGMQMTILGPLNTKAGTMLNPSSGSTLTSSQGRQYFEHNPAPAIPASREVSWTVDWTAPELPPGSVVTWYASGNVTNGNNNNSGDKVFLANGSGTYLVSAVNEPEKRSPLVIYPNPGKDWIQVSFPAQPEVFTLTFLALDGRIVKRVNASNGQIEVADIPSGLYILRAEKGVFSAQARWVKF